MDGDNILVIDDDRSNTQQISEILRSEGYTVYSAKTKVEALETALQIHPVVVLVKSMLIDASGYEVIRDLRNEESLKNLPFIMLSEIEKKYDDRYRTIYKIVDTVKLPVEKEDLLHKIRTHVEWSVPDEEQIEQPEGIALDDEKPAEISFGLNDKARGFSGKPYRDESRVERLDSGSSDAFADEPTAKIVEQDSPPLKSSVHRYSDPEDDYVDSSAEETTAIEADDDEILRAINESRSKRQKFIAITVAAVLLILAGATYMLFFNDTNPVPTNSMLAQATPVKKPIPTPRPPVSAAATPDATAVKPVAATPAPTPAVSSTPSALPKPSATPAPTATPALVTAAAVPTPTATPAPQVKKPEPEVPKPTPTPVSSPAVNAKHTVEPVEKPVEKPVVKPVAQPPAAKAEPDDEVERPAPKVNAAKKKTARNSAKPPAANPPVAAGLYVIQLGSFKEASNAKRLSDMLKKEGYAASILTVKDPQGVTLHKVLAGTYRNKADAMATMKKLKDTKRMDVILRKS